MTPAVALFAMRQTIAPWKRLVPEELNLNGAGAWMQSSQLKYWNCYLTKPEAKPAFAVSALTVWAQHKFERLISQTNSYVLLSKFKKEPYMLVRLLYVSQPVGPVTTTITTSILEKSSAYNRGENITGVLCQGSGLWMQVLEGERHQVNVLYSRIMASRYHHNIELLSMAEITHRQFSEWSMALVHLSKDDPMVRMAHPEFDPYTATSKEALSLLDDLIKTGSPIAATESKN